MLHSNSVKGYLKRHGAIVVVKQRRTNADNEPYPRKRATISGANADRVMMLLDGSAYLHIGMNMVKIDEHTVEVSWKA